MCEKNVFNKFVCDNIARDNAAEEKKQEEAEEEEEEDGGGDGMQN